MKRSPGKSIFLEYRNELGHEWTGLSLKTDFVLEGWGMYPTC